MARIIHTVAVQNQDPAADGLQNHDMPVNPLSVILIALRPLNNTGALADFQQYAGIVDAINRVELLYKGQAVFSMRGRDAAMYALFRHGLHVFQANATDTDNERRCVVLPIVLGRKPYDPQSCFPATRRGELVLSLDLDIADTGYDDLQYTVETIELPDAQPTECEKATEHVVTWPATGINDLDLPIGNLYRGLLLFGTTVFTGAAPASSWGRIQLHLNNMQQAYTSTDWEVANTLGGLYRAKHPNWDEHFHRVNAASASATEPTDTPVELSTPFESYAWLNLDPTDDDLYAIDTAGQSRFHLRADADTADAVRVIPCERQLITNP